MYFLVIFHTPIDLKATLEPTIDNNDLFKRLW
jgi:hypothetical protein